jgi:hypothetical protein
MLSYTAGCQYFILHQNELSIFQRGPISERMSYPSSKHLDTYTTVTMDMRACVPVNMHICIQNAPEIIELQPFEGVPGNSRV